MDKFSKTISLPVGTWNKLEEVRSLMRAPDVTEALIHCVASKHESLTIIKNMNEAGRGMDSVIES